MYKTIPKLTLNVITVQDVLNWLLPALGILASFILIWYLWRYIRNSNRAGRMSEFNEKTFQKLVEKGDHEHPICADCKISMRVEIRYKGFMKDSGDFLISRETADSILQSLVDGKRISEQDRENILRYFNDHDDITEKLFKRYKCPNCSRIIVLPYDN